MFPSVFKELASDVPVLPFRDLRILLMPIIFGDNNSVPDDDCLPMLETMWGFFPQYKDQVVYLTIDQREVKAGETHRRSGLHVDGYPHTTADRRCKENPGIWAGNMHGGTWGGGGGTGGSGGQGNWWDGTGLITVADVQGCKAWNQDFQGEPKSEGDCEHLRSECHEENAAILKANKLYWLSPGCVHESLPLKVKTKRTFVRLSLPSKCDWYEGCTVNRLGVQPTGKIDERRKWMDYEIYDLNYDSIIDFYYSKRTNAAGFYLGEIMGFTNYELEADHDYVQWLFPSNEASQLNKDAPVLTKYEIKEFESNKELQSKVKQSFIRMLDFFGFKMIEENGMINIIPLEATEKRPNPLLWLDEFNHNMLRATRVIKSLRLTGLAEYSLAFFNTLRQYKHKVSPNTFKYWSEAALNPLW